MKLGTVRTPDGDVVVESKGSAVWPLDIDPGVTVLDVIERDLSLTPAASARALDSFEHRVPLAPRKVVAIGLNYKDHIRETGVPAPEVPLVFAKFPSCLLPHNGLITIDRGVTERVDWEVELAVIVGRRMRSVPARDALSYVFGYTVANDISARDLQASDGQWIRGKSIDTFGPLGPWIVTADEVPDPQSLRMETRLNGQVVQSSDTSEMTFPVAELLAFCSRSFTLEPGDVLLTGTPWGCGQFMDPPRLLEHGDSIEVEIEGLGTLSNRVVEMTP